MKNYVSTLLIVVGSSLTGCASYVQEIITKVDSNWQATNVQIMKDLGTRYYKIDKDKAQRAMLIAVSNLGLIVEQQDSKSGFINAKASAPTPLTLPEWQKVAAAETPNAQAIAGSNLVELSVKNRELIANCFILERESDVQINLRIRIKYTADTHGLTFGEQPPPEALRIGLRKVFDEFERVAFVQQVVLDKPLK